MKKISKVRIENKIKKYTAHLRSEKRRFGGYDDSSGLRYLLGHNYLLVDDIKGALRYFKWFKKEFDDDCGEPFQYLSWTVALFLNNQLKDARQKLIETFLKNLYLIPHILGYTNLDIYNMDYHSSNWEHKEYAESLPEEYFNYITDDFKTWADSILNEDVVKSIINRHIELHNKLKNENNSNIRGKLINEINALQGLREIDFDKYSIPTALI